VPVYFLKAKQGYTVREMEKDIYVRPYSSMLISSGTKFRNKKKFQYGMPAYTGPFRALDTG
jgi:hypothetical protein